MKKSKGKCDLNSCFFCTSCMKEWLPAIDCNRKNFNFKKGETIFGEGDKVTGIYFVYEGKVKVHKKWGDDKELIVRFANQGAIVGHRGLGTDNTYPVSATALEPVTVCFIDLEFFQSTLKVNPEFTIKLMTFFAEELYVSEKKMRNLAHMPVKGRIAQALVTLSERFGTAEDGSIDIRLSRQDLASFAGTTYETVFRIMNELVNDQLVEVQGKNITIRDIEKIRELTNQSNGMI